MLNRVVQVPFTFDLPAMLSSRLGNSFRRYNQLYQVLKQTCRWLSEQQAAVALRPFYFEVHPDLFGQFPKQRAVNEDSLKRLNGYLEGLHQTQKEQPLPCLQLEFYVRQKKGLHRMSSSHLNLYPGANRDFQKVQIRLCCGSVRDAVEKLLSSCNLPLDYIKSVPAKQAFPRPIKWDPSFYKAFNIKNPYEQQPKQRQPKPTISSWLRNNITKARENQAGVEPIRAHTEAMCQQLVDQLGLTEVRWEHSWGYRQFRACLGGFQRLYEQHKDEICLTGHSLVFAGETGVSLTGEVILRGDDVPHSWLQLLKSVKNHEEILEKLPCMEQKLSRLLNNVKVIRQQSQQVVTARDYALQLSKVISRVRMYQAEKKHVQLLDDLSDIHLVVDVATGPITLSSTGKIVVPSSCPVFLIMEFLQDNADQARSVALEAQRTKAKEEKLVKHCKTELELLSLSKDKNVTTKQMQACCRHLLDDPVINLGVSLQGCRLRVSHFYSVMSDGQICIPWKWNAASAT